MCGSDSTSHGYVLNGVLNGRGFRNYDPKYLSMSCSHNMSFYKYKELRKLFLFFLPKDKNSVSL